MAKSNENYLNVTFEFKPHYLIIEAQFWFSSYRKFNKFAKHLKGLQIDYINTPQDYKDFKKFGGKMVFCDSTIRHLIDIPKK